MRVCGNCGSEASEGATFCSKCGSELSKEFQQQIVRHQQKRSVPKSNSLLVILIMILSTVIIGGVGVGYYLGSNYFSKEKVVSEFLEGLDKRDAVMVQKHLKVIDSRLNLSTEDIVPLFQLLEDSPSVLNEISNQLNQQITNENLSTYPHSMFRVRKTGKKILIFNQYVIEPSLYFVEIDVLGDTFDLYVNGKPITSKDKRSELGPYIPGVYTFEATQDGQYINLTDYKKVTLLDHSKVKVTLDVRGNYVHIDSNDLMAKLYVNGNDTGLMIAQARNFGPVPIDGSLAVFAVRNENGKTYQSLVSAVESDYVYLEIKKDHPPVQTQTQIIRQPIYIYENNKGFIFPDSHIRRLSRGEVAQLSKYEMYLARNEIFARHGYVFQNEDLRQHFGQMSWYYPNPNYSYTLSQIESYNVELIKSYE